MPLPVRRLEKSQKETRRTGPRWRSESHKEAGRCHRGPEVRVYLFPELGVVIHAFNPSNSGDGGRGGGRQMTQSLKPERSTQQVPG